MFEVNTPVSDTNTLRLITIPRKERIEEELKIVQDGFDKLSKITNDRQLHASIYPKYASEDESHIERNKQTLHEEKGQINNLLKLLNLTHGLKQDDNKLNTKDFIEFCKDNINYTLSHTESDICEAEIRLHSINNSVYLNLEEKLRTYRKKRSAINAFELIKYLSDLLKSRKSKDNTYTQLHNISIALLKECLLFAEAPISSVGTKSSQILCDDELEGFKIFQLLMIKNKNISDYVIYQITQIFTQNHPSFDSKAESKYDKLCSTASINLLRMILMHFSHFTDSKSLKTLSTMHNIMLFRLLKYVPNDLFDLLLDSTTKVMRSPRDLNHCISSVELNQPIESIITNAQVIYTQSMNPICQAITAIEKIITSTQPGVLHDYMLIKSTEVINNLTWKKEDSDFLRKSIESQSTALLQIIDKYIKSLNVLNPNISQDKQIKQFKKLNIASTPKKIIDAIKSLQDMLDIKNQEYKNEIKQKKHTDFKRVKILLNLIKDRKPDALSDDENTLYNKLTIEASSMDEIHKASVSLQTIFDEIKKKREETSPDSMD